MSFGPRHQHAHEAIAVYHQGPSIAAAFGMATVPAATVVLWRCPCRNVDATTLAGKWTLAQIRGEIATDRERIETDLAVTATAAANADS